MAKPKRLLPRAGLHLQRGNEYSHLLKCLFSIFGAEEGTRTPTPLRVHGPEPCASANSATSALRSGKPRAAYDLFSLSNRVAAVN